MAGSNPRAARVAALIKRVIAESVEFHLHDERLANVTITDVRVTNDLQIAKVYWTQLGTDGKERGERDRAQKALRQAAGRLRSHVGAKAGLRLTPQLRFIYDKVPQEAHEIEDILSVARHRDAELEKTRSTASYAGESNPYRHDDEPDNDQDGFGQDGVDDDDDDSDTDDFDE